MTGGQSAPARPGERTAISARAERVAQRLIRGACRRLPEDDQDVRYREWAAEIPAILDDPRTPSLLRPARALVYALGISRCARHPQLAARGQDGDAVRAAVLRVARGLGIYLGVTVPFIALTLAIRPQRPWLLIMGVTACFCLDVFCLADLARAGRVRYLPKWVWALACLVQSPFGGIMYLSVGRVRS